MSDSQIKYELRCLVFLSLEGEATEQQYQRLNELLRSSQECFNYYLELIQLHQAIQSCNWQIEYEDVFSLQKTLEEFAIYEKTAPKIEISEEKPQRELIEKVIHVPREKNKMSTFNKFTFAACAAVLLFFVCLRFAPTSTGYEPVARVVNLVDAKWNQDNIPTIRTDIMKGPLTLTEGILKIAMYDGTEVVLNAPAEVEFEEISQLYLAKGVMRANVPPVAIGFTVRTPHGLIVDYGTEFSVEVNKNQSKTLVEVFKGIVELRDSSNPQVYNSAQKLSAGQKGQIDVNHKITWSESIAYPDREIISQWKCPNAVGLWTEPSYWSDGIMQDSKFIAEFKAEDETKTILINSSMTGSGKIKARRADVGLTSSYPVTVQMDGGQVQLEQLWIGRMGRAETTEGRWIMSDGELILKGRDPVCLFVGDACKGVMEVNGGSVEVFGEAKIGWVGDSMNILGTKSANGTLKINNGQFLVYGHLDVGGMGTVGTIHLSGGQMQVFELLIREKSSFIITGGQLIIEGDKMGPIQNMIDAGLVKSPDHEILVEYDAQGDRGFGSDKTIISVKK